MRTVIFIILTMLFGCEDDPGYDCDGAPSVEPVGLFVDSQLSDRDTAILLDGVDRLNDLGMSEACFEPVEVIGSIVVDKSVHALSGGKTAGYYEKPDWYDDYYAGLKGSANAFDNVRLFFFTKDMGRSERLSLVMHELFHFIGIHDHSDDPRDIMYTSEDGKTSYTSGDIELFCSVYDCAD